MHVLLRNQQLLTAYYVVVIWEYVYHPEDGHPKHMQDSPMVEDAEDVQN